MTNHDQAIRRFRRRVGWLLFLRHAFLLLTAWAFLWGMAVLVMRVIGGVPLAQMLWGLAGAPVVVIAAGIWATRRLPAPVAVRALIDHQSRCGGLYMAGHDVPLGGWQSRLAELRSPQVRWRGGKAFGLFCLGAAFVAVCFLFPQRLIALSQHQVLEIDEEVRKIAKQIETLKEEKILEASRATELEKKLKQVQEEAAGEDPAKTWEALDHLQQMAAKEAKTGAEQALAETEKLSKAEKLADALQKAAADLKPEDLAAAMDELAEMVDKAAKENKELMEKNTSEEILNAAKEGNLTPEQMKELKDALKKGKQDLKKKLEQLREAGLIDLNTLQKCEQLAKKGEDGSSLAEYLKENGIGDSISELLDKGDPGGQGGDEEAGNGELSFRDPTKEDGAKFKEQILPPASLEAIKDSSMVGVSKAKPKTNPKEAAAQSGALGAAKAGGGSANTQMILPRHRGTVERYFERK